MADQPESLADYFERTKRSHQRSLRKLGHRASWMDGDSYVPPMALPYIHFDSYNRDVLSVLSMLGVRPGGAIEQVDPKTQTTLMLDPPYQRGSVWGRERQINLIRSVLMGIPHGSVFLNTRHILQPVVVVDGRQRIEALFAFVKGDFGIPAEWLDGERGEHMLSLDAAEIERRKQSGEPVFFHEFTMPGKRFVMSRPFPTLETKFPTEAEEKVVFDLVNHGGVPAGSSDFA